jgi:hypothetical protein
MALSFYGCQLVINNQNLEDNSFALNGFALIFLFSTATPE